MKVISVHEPMGDESKTGDGGMGDESNGYIAVESDDGIDDNAALSLVTFAGDCLGPTGATAPHRLTEESLSTLKQGHEVDFAAMRWAVDELLNVRRDSKDLSGRALWAWLTDGNDAVSDWWQTHAPQFMSPPPDWLQTILSPAAPGRAEAGKRA